MKNKLKETVKQRLESSSLIIFPNIVKNDSKILKIIWLILSFVSAGFCSMLIIKNVNDYLSYQVITKTNVNYETKLKFPVVSICNSFSQEAYDLVELNKSAIQSLPNFEYNYYTRIYLKYYKNKGINITKMGKSLKETMFRCSFMQHPCNVSQDFEEYYDMNYGRCFRFNSNKQKYVTKNGKFYSLDMDFYIDENYYNTGQMDQKGLKIFISDDPTSSVNQDSITIPNGFCSNIAMRKTSITKQRRPYSNCDGDLTNIDSYGSDVYKIAFESNQNYNYLSCKNICYQKLLANQCKCQTAYLDKAYDQNLRVCYLDLDYLEEDNACETEVWFNFLNNPNDFCDCPIKCDYVDYSYSISLSDYPTNSYFKSLISNNPLIKSKYKNQSFDEMRQSMVRINIYYDQMFQISITENIKTEVSDLVANIGGLLGLFLGFSFLSLIELIELFCKIFTIIIKKKKNNVISSSKIDVKPIQF